MELKDVVERIKVTMEMFKELPVEYSRYVKVMESATKGYRYKPRVGHLRVQTVEFGFGKVYKELNIDHVYTNTDKVIVIRYYGWFVERRDDRVMIMLGYHVDVLDKDVAMDEVSWPTHPATRM
jgi:hypothetical protein